MKWAQLIPAESHDVLLIGLGAMVGLGWAGNEIARFSDWKRLRSPFSREPDTEPVSCAAGIRPKGRRTRSPPIAHFRVHYRRRYLENFVQLCLRFPKPEIMMHAMKKDEEILTIGQVADFLKVTDRTIYRLAAAREIPAFKVGGSWRFRKADIDDWIALQAIKPGGQTD